MAFPSPEEGTSPTVVNDRSLVGDGRATGVWENKVIVGLVNGSLSELGRLSNRILSSEMMRDNSMVDCGASPLEMTSPFCSLGAVATDMSRTTL